ncbi:BMP family ABC transporter substrate-binding protein (plasmid) [Paroceanicella profunda]|uniref:BMP family ABC transporter substrate-binding protein n=1 Tax=Paroceanicella profunda TaxID=2579971 RepID=A0A5B8FZ14_9RHOB|nr:BMP family ABC transporter substrate-binding protein [Paroceanicella profunda]QDL94156.1 BMP family ABC transporter substrate-binding protein [Paroceanicella profunda]
MRSVLAALCLALAMPGFAPSAAADPALVYSVGGKFDRSFNEAAYTGAEAWKRETGGSYGEFEIDSPVQSEQALRNFARKGYSPVVAIGFMHADALARVAPDYPDTRFAIIDMVVPGENVQSVVYREQEGAYVVGVMAAMASRSGKIGFVGGMDIPLIRRFACGYAQGISAAQPGAELFVAMAGDTPAAWSDPARGAELARAQIDRGADVVMQAAGGTGTGVLQAAADAGVLGIGTDSNQNGLHPGQVLTSMLKRVDVAVMRAFSGWRPGVTSLGLAEGGVGYAMDADNAALVTPQIRAAAKRASADIVSGAVKVIDHAGPGPCPFP